MTTTAPWYIPRHSAMMSLLSSARANAPSDIMLNLLARHSPSPGVSEASTIVPGTILCLLSPTRRHKAISVVRFQLPLMLSLSPHSLPEASCHIDCRAWATFTIAFTTCLLPQSQYLLKSRLPLGDVTPPWIDQMQWSARCHSTPKQRPSVR